MIVWQNVLYRLSISFFLNGAYHSPTFRQIRFYGSLFQWTNFASIPGKTQTDLNSGACMR